MDLENNKPFTWFLCVPLVYPFTVNKTQIVGFPAAVALATGMYCWRSTDSWHSSVPIELSGNSLTDNRDLLNSWQDKAIFEALSWHK